MHVRDGDLDGDPDEGHASLFDSSAVRVVALGTFAPAKVVPCAPYVSVHVPPGSNKKEFLPSYFSFCSIWVYSVDKGRLKRASRSESPRKLPQLDLKSGTRLASAIYFVPGKPDRCRHGRATRNHSAEMFFHLDSSPPNLTIPFLFPSQSPSSSSSPSNPTIPYQLLPIPTNPYQTLPTPTIPHPDQNVPIFYNDAFDNPRIYERINVDILRVYEGTKNLNSWVMYVKDLRIRLNSKRWLHYVQTAVGLLTLIKRLALVKRPNVVCLEVSGPKGTSIFNFSRQFLSNIVVVVIITVTVLANMSSQECSKRIRNLRMYEQVGWLRSPRKTSSHVENVKVNEQSRSHGNTMCSGMPANDLPLVKKLREREKEGERGGCGGGGDGDGDGGGVGYSAVKLRGCLQAAGQNKDLSIGQPPLFSYIVPMIHLMRKKIDMRLEDPLTEAKFLVIESLYFEYS
ncbi:hypothetical protein V1478_010633 [Vespula squamosa]|uniref:Uncharacterized protein n=1 Tax=Vespula squamosa TaxID=30214 RepID=A0ABD2AJ76_VESSQ